MDSLSSRARGVEARRVLQKVTQRCGAVRGAPERATITARLCHAIPSFVPFSCAAMQAKRAMRRYLMAICASVQRKCCHRFSPSTAAINVLLACRSDFMLMLAMLLTAIRSSFAGDAADAAMLCALTMTRACIVKR